MLISCPECGERISDQAEACPHCGVAVQGGEEPVHPDKTLSVSRRFTGIILFSSLAIVFMDVVLYIIGRLVLMPKVKSAFTSYSTSLTEWDVPWNKFKALVMIERDLAMIAGGILVLVSAVLLSWMLLRVLHLGRARRGTQVILGCLISGETIVTLLALWTVWASSYLPLPSSFYPEFPPTWVGWISLRNGIPAYPPDQSWLVPAVSLGFLIPVLIIAALRAAYLRLFERR
jgi:hypothetical protein